VRRAFHGDLLNVRAIRRTEYDLAGEEEHRDAPEQTEGDLQAQHDAEETQVALWYRNRAGSIIFEFEYSVHAASPVSYSLRR
jgi:hypothetical protein